MSCDYCLITHSLTERLLFIQSIDLSDDQPYSCRCPNSLTGLEDTDEADTSCDLNRQDSTKSTVPLVMFDDGLEILSFQPQPYPPSPQLSQTPNQPTSPSKTPTTLNEEESKYAVVSTSSGSQPPLQQDTVVQYQEINIRATHVS